VSAHRALDILDPRASALGRHRCDVDPDAIHTRILREATAPEPLGGEDQMPSLRGRHARERALERARTSRAYLDDDDERSLAGDDVELEVTEADVPREDAEPSRRKEVCDGLLGSSPVACPRAQYWGAQ